MPHRDLNLVHPGPRTDALPLELTDQMVFERVKL